MAGTITLTIIKPDAFGGGKAGKIIAHLEQQGFTVRAARVLHMSQAEAGEFYAVHSERPFYASLVSFMTSGACMPMILEKADAVASLRGAIGATDPAQAEAGTVRQLFAESKERNAIHASDSDENAAREARFFFAETEVLARKQARDGHRRQGGALGRGIGVQLLRRQRLDARARCMRATCSKRLVWIVFADVVL